MLSESHQVVTQNLFSIHMFSFVSQGLSQTVLIVSLMKYKQVFLNQLHLPQRYL